MLYEFHLHGNAAIAYKNICRAYPEEIFGQRMCERWFQRFRSGDTNLEDEERSGRPSKFNPKMLEEMIHDDPRQSTRKLGEELGVNHMTVYRHLTAVGRTWRRGALVPHELSERNKLERVRICRSLLDQAANSSFLDNLITGDEKWVHYDNPGRRGQWLLPGEVGIPAKRARLTPKKIMLCVWWNRRGIIYYEFLQRNTTINSASYSLQLEKVQDALRKSGQIPSGRRKILFLQDNARAHVAAATMEKIRVLRWKALPHPAYSPDLAPTDYHLFRSMQHALAGKIHENDDMVEDTIKEFFDSKPPSFFQDGIAKLVARWQWVIDNNGDYFID